MHPEFSGLYYILDIDTMDVDGPMSYEAALNEIEEETYTNPVMLTLDLETNKLYATKP